MDKKEPEKLNSESKKLERFTLTLREKKFLAIIVMFSLIFGAMGSVLGIKTYGEIFGEKGLKTVFTGNKNIKVEENSAIIDAVEKVGPSVVSITSEQNALDFFGQSSKSKSSGTGFIITEDGLIITNKHVVSDDGAQYSVFTSDGKEYKAEVKAKDSLNDIAFLKINGNGLKAVEMGDSNSLKVGQTVVAIGNALGQYQNTVTSGVISAIGRAVPVSDGTGSDVLENVIQTDAAINPGNSGGPLINLEGQVVGINTAIDSSGQSIGFAIPINNVKNITEGVEKTGKVRRPYLGIRYVAITKEFASRNEIDVSYGVLIYGGEETPAIVSGSPADRAGLKEDDILLEINGEKIDKTHTLIGILQKYNPGDEVTLKYLREGTEKSVKVKLAETK